MLIQLSFYCVVLESLIIFRYLSLCFPVAKCLLGFPGCSTVVKQSLGVGEKNPGRKSFIFDITAAESGPSKG